MREALPDWRRAIGDVFLRTHGRIAEFGDAKQFGIVALNIGEIISELVQKRFRVC